MKRVWKCDYCYITDVLLSKITEHEENCTDNPKNKYCWSCKFHDFGYCVIKFDILSGEELGNCDGWKSADEKLYRKLKLNKLNEKT